MIGHSHSGQNSRRARKRRAGGRPAVNRIPEETVTVHSDSWWDIPRKRALSGFTSTPVPRYSGESNWEQYREVFEAIVSSNGWDGVTAALQLLSTSLYWFRSLGVWCRDF